MAQYGVKEVMDFTITDYNPLPYKRKPILSVDYAQMTDIENAAERLDIAGGRGNARLLSFDHSKTTAVNLTLPLIDMKMLAAISGDEIEDRIKEIFKREVVLVTEENGDSVAKLKHAPIAASVYAYILEGNRDLGVQLTPAEGDEPIVAEAGEYTLEGDTLILNPETNPAGSEVVVYYHTRTATPVQNLQINPTKFPKAISFYGDTLFRNQYDEEDEVYNVVGHKGRIRPNYTLSMNATDVAVLELVVDMYAVKDQETNEEMYVEYIKDPEAGE